MELKVECADAQKGRVSSRFTRKVGFHKATYPRESLLGAKTSAKQFYFDVIVLMVGLLSTRLCQ